MKRLCLLFIIAIFTFSSCTSTRIQRFVTTPEIYQDNDIDVEFRVGTRVYFLKITNKTDQEFFLDFDRVTVITASGQANALKPLTTASSIPPNSFVVLSSDAHSIYQTDINTVFINYEASAAQYAHSDLSLMNAFVGDSIRIILPISVGGVESVRDIELTLVEIFDPRKH